MRTRRKGGRWAAVVVATGLLFALAGCSGGGDDEDADKSSPSQQDDKGGDGDSSSQNGGGEGEVLAEVKGGSDISLTINSAEREEGGFLTLNGEVSNSGGKFWSGVEWKADEKELAEANPSSMAGASLVDKKGKKKYLVLRDTDGRCLCTAFKGGLQSGQTKTWYAQFPAPPKGNDVLDFQVGDLPTASITISGE